MGPLFIGAHVEELMRKAIGDIRDGTFAKWWTAEQAAGSRMFQQLLDQVLDSPVARAEAELYAKLGRR